MRGTQKSPADSPSVALSTDRNTSEGARIPDLEVVPGRKARAGTPHHWPRDQAAVRPTTRRHAPAQPPADSSLRMSTETPVLRTRPGVRVPDVPGLHT